MQSVNDNPVIREIYIGSGLKNGFYTLRSHTHSGLFSTDIYLRNLSTDPDKAEAKAKAYFDRVYGDNCANVRFLGYADFDLTPWGKALEPWQHRQIASIDFGAWPFGKYKGRMIAETTEGYILYWAQMKVENDPVANALIEKCRSIADDRNLRMIFEEKRKVFEAAKEEQRAKSTHVGTVGKREIFNLTISHVVNYDSDFGNFYINIMEDADRNCFVYKGSKELGKKGETIKLKASVREHSERDGIKQTIVCRPAIQ